MKRTLDDVAREAAPFLAELVRKYPPAKVARLSATDEATPKDAA